jgi:hypothetical protein
MNPILSELGSFVNPISVVEFAQSLPAKIDKDEMRMRLFGVAVVNKVAEIATKTLANALNPETPQTIQYNGTPVPADKAHAEEFGKDFQAILGEYVHDAESLAPKKWSLGTVFKSSDPFAPGRAGVRAFAHKWDLDPAFVEAMG